MANQNKEDQENDEKLEAESNEEEEESFENLETVEPPESPLESSPRSVDITLNPSIIQTLAKRQPEKLISLADSAEERIYQFSLKKENNSYNLKRLGLLALVIVILSGFVYAGFTGNEELPREIIHYLMGGGASLGVAVFLRERSNK